MTITSINIARLTPISISMIGLEDAVSGRRSWDVQTEVKCI